MAMTRESVNMPGEGELFRYFSSGKVLAVRDGIRSGFYIPAPQRPDRRRADGPGWALTGIPDDTGRR